MYKLAVESWDTAEYEAIKRVVESGRFTLGEEVRNFEIEFANKFGSSYALMVNSGSSANLLALDALNYHSKYRGMRGKKILVPAVSWATTYYPISQAGYEIKLVDIDIHTLNIDVERLENEIDEDTGGIFCVNLLGNSCEYNRIKELCDKYGLLFFEDNCESLGSMYDGKYCGTFGIFGTFSTYFSHHISTMEGGLIVTDDRELYDIMKSMRSHGWTRGLDPDSPIYSSSSEEFYESFNFILPGYNLRPLEMEGAIGRSQLEKVDNFILNRRANAKYLEKVLSNTNVLLQKEVGASSWFGFSMILDSAQNRDKLVKKFLENGIECRPIVAGNFARNPVAKLMRFESSDNLICSDSVHERGLFIGNHNTDVRTDLSRVAGVVSDVLD